MLMGKYYKCDNITMIKKMDLDDNSNNKDGGRNDDTFIYLDNN